MSNIFTKYKNQKEILNNIIEKAKEYEWLNAEEITNLRSKLENDILRIGIIGQMKCGKSTYINSLIFGDDILPSSATPMTAALSFITYGETERIEVEFYSNDDWEEQVRLSNMPYDENSFEDFNLRIKAAKELVMYSNRLGNSLYSLLGTKKEDKLTSLKEYVGSSGKYVSIVKQVKIYYPLEYLKGVEIVDTPGFNDPIQSREQRTNKFLKTADAVIMLIYAGKPFSLEDKCILFNNVRKCGIGKVIIGVNKYDIPYGQGYTKESIALSVKQSIEDSAGKYEDHTIEEIARSVNPIPISAEMALISKLSMSKILSNNDHKRMWERCAMDNNRLFDNISEPSQLYELSNVEILNNAIIHVLNHEKYQILFKKIESAIITKGTDILSQIISDLELKKAKLRLLNAPDSELDDMLHDLSNAKHIISRKIENLELNLAEYFDDFVINTKEELEDLFDDSCKKCLGFIDNIGITESIDQLTTKIRVELNSVEKTLKRKLTRNVKSLKENINIRIIEFLNSLSRTISRSLPEFDCDGFITTLKKKLQLSASLENYVRDCNEDDDEYTFISFITDIVSEVLEEYINILTLGYYGRIQAKNKLREGIVILMEKFDITPSLTATLQNKTLIMDNIRTACFEGLIKPLESMIENANNNLEDKEQQILATNIDINNFELRKSKLETENDIIKGMIAECYLNNE